MSEKELMNFIISLDDRGLLSKSIDEVDYEKVIWEFLQKDKLINRVMDGNLVTYCGFSHSDRNILNIEVTGHHNYIVNTLKKGDGIKLIHYKK